MRADRLIALLLLLQARGKLTAAELAAELEVSVRTVYRDIEALGTAGVPIYTDAGPGGGCQLLDTYRAPLTGLTPDEASALLAVGVPAAVAELGLSGPLGGARLKVAAATRTPGATRFHVDTPPWFRRAE